MPSIDEIRDWLDLGNRQLWLFILVAGATLLTLQTIESTIETAWPHQRREGGQLPGERRSSPIMAIVAILVLVGALLSLATLGVMLWQDVEASESQRLAAVLLLAGWVAFLFANLGWFGVGRLLRETGVIGPLALCVLLLVADLLLLIGFIEIVPAFEEIWDAIEDLLPFLGDESETATVG